MFGIIRKLLPAVLPFPLNLIAGALGWIKDAIAAGLAWAWKHPWQAGCIILACSSLWLWNGRESARSAVQEQKALVTHWRGQFRFQKEEMIRFDGMVKAARIEAARLDRENKVRVEREQDQAIKEALNAYRKNHAVADAALDERLRRPGSTATCAAGSGGGAAQLPVISDMPGGIVRPGGASIVSEADARICAGNTVRLEELIAAWSAVSAIDVNEGTAAP